MRAACCQAVLTCVVSGGCCNGHLSNRCRDWSQGAGEAHAAGACGWCGKNTATSATGQCCPAQQPAMAHSGGYSDALVVHSTRRVGVLPPAHAGAMCTQDPAQMQPAPQERSSEPQQLSAPLAAAEDAAVAARRHALSTDEASTSFSGAGSMRASATMTSRARSAPAPGAGACLTHHFGW